MKKKILSLTALAMLGLPTLSACSQSDVASQNISTASDNFQVERRIVFINGITDKYLLEIQGRCSIKADGEDKQVEVTCKVGEGNNDFKKHYLGLSDNVTYMVEQLEPIETDPWHYKVNFRPETLVPDIDLKTSGGDKQG